MNEIFNQMMALHKREGSDGERNALYEVMQQVVLSGMYATGYRLTLLTFRKEQGNSMELNSPKTSLSECLRNVLRKPTLSKLKMM